MDRGDTAREVVGADQGRPDEDRAVLADGDAGLDDQKAGGGDRGGDDQVGRGDRDLRRQGKAEETGQRHRSGGCGQCRGVAAGRVREDQ